MSNGDTYTFAEGVNPWTGKIAKDATTNGVYDPNKVFGGENGGYQPNNYRGVKLKKSGAITNYNGQNQNVWRVGNTSTYVVWDGKKGDYIVLNDAEKKLFGLK